jgi:uncharacterized iron-regulated protein
VDPGDRRLLAHATVLERAARANVVLLGEEHDASEHHRWQLSVLAALLARRATLVVGLEALPRSAQPVLDEWSAGHLDTPALLERTRWHAYWGPGADQYLPLVQWARLHRQPLLGLNVSRTLVARVGREGWSSVPVAAREGLTDPVPPDAAYRHALAQAYAEHACREADTVIGMPAFGRFVEAQLTWDRAMAEAIAAARRSRPEALVVGIMGRGHLEHGTGVPRQLAALDVGGVEVLLPWDHQRPCAELTPGLATAVFGVAAPADERAAMAVARAALTPPCARRAPRPERSRAEPGATPARP